jgi:hypothetical protein
MLDAGLYSRVPFDPAPPAARGGVADEERRRRTVEAADGYGPTAPSPPPRARPAFGQGSSKWHTPHPAPPPGRRAAATRTHATVRDHPSSALLAVRTRRYGRVADELPTLQLSPKHLQVLRDHVLSEPDDQHLHSLRCCDHRENPRNPQRPRTQHRHPRRGARPGRREGRPALRPQGPAGRRARAPRCNRRQDGRRAATGGTSPGTPGSGAGTRPGPASLIWPHRDGLIWPHFRHAGVPL